MTRRRSVCARMGLELDLANQAAYLEGANLNCTRLEFDILCQMVKLPRARCSAMRSFRSGSGDTRTCTTQRCLRATSPRCARKIRKAGGNEDMIRTVHGVGYSFTPV